MKRKNVIIIFILLALAGGLIFFFFKNRSPEVTYRAIKVKRSDLVLWVQATGTVSPQNRLEIKPPVAGRIEEVLVKEGDEVKKGTILAWISSNERAALLDAVRTQGAAEIKKWETLYRPTPVIAPINGTIILRKVEAGQSFTSADPIFVMADRLTVKAKVDETDIALIKLNQEAKIVLDAYPNEPIEGRVVHLAYDATLLNNVTTYEVDVLPLSPPDFMRSGMTSSVNVEVERKEKVLSVPVSVLIHDEQGTLVLLQNGDKKTAMPVKTGFDDGKNIEIIEGLQENDTVFIKESSPTARKVLGRSPISGGGGRRR